MSRGFLQFIQFLAASVFIGIATYGIIIYFGGEMSQRVPPWKSLLLGAASVVCIGVIMATGTLIDRKAMTEEDEKGSAETAGGNDSG